VPNVSSVALCFPSWLDNGVRKLGEGWPALVPFAFMAIECVVQMRHKKPRSAAWLSGARWKLVQESVPIVCVDIMPIRTSRCVPCRVEAIGLILRDTPHQRQRWCLIGGRVLRGESLRDAIHRQIVETLGTEVRILLKRDQQPLYISQYAPHGTKPFFLDPRQHAVGLTYAFKITGSPIAQGEAVAYRWFDIGKLPPPERFGFGQDRLVNVCLQLLRRVCRDSAKAQDERF
jgi:ADP-ribose pyrophosphatase YjhB (NUDIX family)